MTEAVLSEWTSGSVGWMHMRGLCFISLDDEGIKIRGFRRISFGSIERVVSEKYWGFPYLRIVHRESGVNPNVRFISTNWNAWFTALEERGIRTEDPLRLRDANTTGIKLAKAVNLLVGTLALVAVAYALARSFLH